MQEFFQNMNYMQLLYAFLVGGVLCIIGQILIDKTKLNREFYETQWIKDMIWININDLINMLSQPSSDIARVVYRREKIVLEKVKELI